jgi:predicted metal-dependent HD superfamily phosphohydrolase
LVHRYYHTIEHIKSCLALFDRVKDELNNPESVELALWFLDVIYNSRKRNNEELSASFSKELLSRIGVSDTVISSVCELILATKHPFIPTNDEERYIIDIDLAVLGAPPTQYHQYSEQIRMEYSHVPALLYKRGRVKVLASFLNQTAIFNTKYFGSRFEASARDNLKNEVGYLK